MKKYLRFIPVVVAAAFLAGCQGPCASLKSITGVQLTSGSADFTTFVSVGTSISAGYQSGGLVNHHQIRSFPALFAYQTGKILQLDGMGSFTFPAISPDGIAPLLEIKSLSPLLISNAGRMLGAPLNLTQPTAYHNLAVPGQLAIDLVDSTYYTQDPNMIRGAGFDHTMFDLIYRHRGLGIEQLLSLQPTFVSYEFGANEVLGFGTAGIAPPGNVGALQATFQPSVTGAMDAIHATLPNTKVAIFNVPNVTSIPFFTTFPPYTVNLASGAPVPLIGPGGPPLTPSDLVTLRAADSLAIGTGIPVGGYNYVNPQAPGNGRPLLDSQVLSVAEQATLTGAIDAMNAVIDSVSMRPFIAKVDLNGLLADVAANGYTIGANTYSSDFVTGGIFSLDGVHPNDLAHAILCNTMIDAVNARFGSTVPRVNPSLYATATASAARPARREDGLPRALQIEGLTQGLDRLFHFNP